MKFEHWCIHCGTRQLDLVEASEYIGRGFLMGFQCKECNEEGNLLVDGVEIKTMEQLLKARNDVISLIERN